MIKTRTIDEEAERIANYLCSIPANGNTTCTTKVLKALLLKYDGRLSSFGELWDVQSKRVGPGIYRVSLKKCVF
jgi:hypothetical protein